jgi:hypothetical protein
MAKIDKSQYSKEEWRRIKEQRRLEKEAKAEQERSPAPLVSKPIEETKNYVLCLKHGIKYGPEYVNTLYKMVKRNLTIPFEMVCLTDDPKGIDPGIKILDLPSNLEGWWCKPYMFSADLPIKGNILYMDLDVVIAGNLDKLFTFQPNNWCVIRDFTKVMRPQWKGYNSSVIRFKTGQLDHVWTRFIKDHHRIARRHQKVKQN